MRPLDLKGQRFGRLTVLHRDKPKETRPGLSMWMCLCDCGLTHVTTGHSLKQGYTKSCGCLLKETTRAMSYRHGGRHSKEYRTWCSMKGRCLCPTDHAFPRYGGRGITVSDEWTNDFAAFRRDMGECPRYHTLDRIDVNGPYSKDNCRWANARVQASNRRRNVWIDWRGEILTQSEWARRLDTTPRSVGQHWRKHGHLDRLAERQAAIRHPNS